MLATVRSMPWALRGFLAYALVILAAIGLTLPLVVELANTMPISVPGIGVMALLAYTIFSITLVLQRKEAARGLALGLSSLPVPLAIWAFLVGQPVLGLFAGALALLLVQGLRRGSVSTWLSEP